LKGCSKVCNRKRPLLSFSAKRRICFNGLRCFAFAQHDSKVSLQSLKKRDSLDVHRNCVTPNDDFIGALPDALAGDLIGRGGGLLCALSFQNKPTRTGYARLGRANPSARYGWERSFHIDYHPRYGRHFNADFVPLSRFNHSTLPDWARNIGTNRALRNIGRGAVALGLTLDALSILTAPPCEKGRAIGGAIGGAGGSIVGAAVGSAIAPGVGTIIGGAAGGFLGGLVGDWLGSRFRPEVCDCP
jgi:hypothetical protein